LVAAGVNVMLAYTIGRTTARTISHIIPHITSYIIRNIGIIASAAGCDRRGRCCEEKC